jgi:hypothetical protein
VVIERQRYGGKLAQMIDRQRADRPFTFDERAQRHLASVCGTDIKQIERVGIELETWVDFEHHPIIVLLGEELDDLALPERIVKRVIDGLYRNASTRSSVAIDFQPDRWSGDLLVCRHVA